LAPKVTSAYKQKTRERILEGAEALFSREGYYDTSMDEIVRESGLSKGAIYGYFSSKEELFLALEDRDLALTLARVKAAFAPGDSAKSKLEKAAEVAFSSLMGATKKACRMSLEFSVAAPRIRPLMHRQDDRYRAGHSLVAEIIREGVRSGEFREEIDVEISASILLAVVDGLSLHWATTTREFDWAKVRAQLSTIVLNGMLAEGRRGVSRR